MSDGMKDDHVPTPELAELLGLIWNKIVREVNRLLDTHAKFGYFQFSENLDPSLQEVIQGFEFIDFALTQLKHIEGLDYEEVRVIINSKQCILKMSELAAAIENDDEAEYDRIIRDLRNQAP